MGLFNAIHPFYNGYAKGHAGGSKGADIRSLLAVGNLEQDGTPTPSDPLPIVCNKGELVAVPGKNLFNKNTAKLNKTISSADGSELNSNGYYHTDLISVVEGAEYIRSNNGVAAGNTIHKYDSNKTWIGYDTPGIGVPYTIPIGVSYIAFNCIELKSPIATMQFELGSTATAYEPYQLHIEAQGASYLTDSKSNVVNLPMLLKDDECFDDYTTMQRVVTHKYVVKVLDGTETWVISYAGFFDTYVSPPAVRYQTYSTHYKKYNGDIWPDSDDRDGYIVSSSSGKICIGERNRFNGDTSAFKAFLASEYSAGHPVIIVYPLANDVVDSPEAITDRLRKQPVTQTSEVDADVTINP